MVFVLSAQLTLFIALITFLSPRKLFNNDNNNDNNNSVVGFPTHWVVVSIMSLIPS